VLGTLEQGAGPLALSGSHRFGLTWGRSRRVDLSPSIDGERPPTLASRREVRRSRAARPGAISFRARAAPLRGPPPARHWAALDQGRRDASRSPATPGSSRFTGEQAGGVWPRTCRRPPF